MRPADDDQRPVRLGQPGQRILGHARPVRPHLDQRRAQRDRAGNRAQHVPRAAPAEPGRAGLRWRWQRPRATNSGSRAASRPPGRGGGAPISPARRRRRDNRPPGTPRGPVSPRAIWPTNSTIGVLSCIATCSPADALAAPPGPRVTKATPGWPGKNSAWPSPRPSSRPRPRAGRQCWRWRCHAARPAPPGNFPRHRKHPPHPQPFQLLHQDPPAMHRHLAPFRYGPRHCARAGALAKGGGPRALDPPLNNSEPDGTPQCPLPFFGISGLPCAPPQKTNTMLPAARGRPALRPRPVRDRRPAPAPCMTPIWKRPRAFPPRVRHLAEQIAGAEAVVNRQRAEIQQGAAGWGSSRPRARLGQPGSRATPWADKNRRLASHVGRRRTAPAANGRNSPCG